MQYHFADCVLDIASHKLFRQGAEVQVEPQVFDLLHLLAENAGRLVTKDQLVDTIWNGRIVSEATISGRINAARTAVGDTGKDQAVIRTHSRRGFELVAPATLNEQPLAAPQAPDMRQTIRYTTSPDGTQIAYATSGEGPPILRAGHFLTHLEMDWRNLIWQPYLQAHSQNHSLVRYDQRGCGMSDPDVSKLSLKAYAADLLAVADAAGLDRFSLLGSSQGVPISIYVAANYPERVSRMVLYGGAAQGRALRDPISKEEAAALITMVRTGWGKPQSAFMKAFTSLFCPGASHAELASLVDIQLTSATPENVVEIRRAIDHMDVRQYMPMVKTPTLVIHSRNESLNPVAQGRLIAASIPGAEFLEIDSNNHVPLPSDPAWQTIIDAQLAFLGAT